MAEPDTTVEKLMTSPVEAVSPDATLSEAARVLDAEGIGSLVVGEELDPSTPVSELMSDPVVTIRRTGTLRAAAERMGHNGVKKLPVVEDGGAVGIITTTDLALHLPNLEVNMAHQAEPDIVDGEWE